MSHYETVRIRKDGQLIHISLMISPVRDTTGKIVGASTIARDISGHKRVEEALRESEERYRSLFEGSRDAIYTSSQQGEILDANQSMLDLFGYSREEIIGLKARETYVHPEDRLKFQQKIEREGFVRDYEIKLRKKDGREMDCLLTATVRRTGDGNILGYQGIIRDITERKRAEEALKESELKYRTLIESSTDAILLLDVERNIVTCNQAFLNLFGYQKGEIEGRSIRIIHPSDESFHSFGKTAYPVVARSGFFRKEWRFTHKDGMIFPAETVTSAIKLPDGSITGHIGIIRDITERKRAEEEREKLIHELQEALANIKTLHGLLPICSYCKKIRDDKGYWNQIESYIRDHSGAEFTHGMCPECMKKLYPDLVD